MGIDQLVKYAVVAACGAIVAKVVVPPVVKATAFAVDTAAVTGARVIGAAGEALGLIGKKKTGSDNGGELEATGV